MSNEQSQITDQDFQRLLTEAKDALVEKNYEEAEAKFKAALERGREVHPEPCSSTTACLVGLGDVYFGATMFEPAKDFYKKALAEHDRTEKSERKDRISPMFRYCKTLTVLNEFSEADKSFAETVELAELLLPLGNPLLTGIYDAYANMLAQSQLEPGPEREHYFREKAEACRRKYVAPMRPRPTETKTNLPKLRRAEKPDANLFEKLFSPGSFSDLTVWCVRNYKFFVILLLVSAAAVAAMDPSLRNSVLHFFK